MATVKGDVHDIGKNIVGVVLRCNNYQVIDLGVMVPCQKILDAAIEHKADIIGLSGLITPSLEEMSHVAKEMQRQGFSIPLLIGGATTSKVHTAVKIAPHYQHPVIYVPDASRAVGVCSNLLSDTLRDGFVAENQAEQDRAREGHANKASRKVVGLEQARANKEAIDWAYQPPTPRWLGVRRFEHYPLAEIAAYIDWTPFFQSWELAGRFPRILNDEIVGESARALYEDAQVMLKQIIAENWLGANAVIGLFPAASVNHDDIEIRDPDNRASLMSWVGLRQQPPKMDGKANWALADYIAPRDSGVQDYIGAFAVTAGIGIEPHVQRFEDAGDDYSSILLKALADRLAEAFAELMHARVRREFWGYAAAEQLDNEALIDEKYQGIRPAPGYPACPDHTVKSALFELLDAPAIGMTLTEGYAMLPTAAVSGFYLSHPAARYFGVGKIERDQVASYAERRGVSVEQAERDLAPIWAMTPEARQPWPRLLLASLIFGVGAWLLFSFRDRYVVLLLAGALLAWQALPAGFKTRALLLTAAGGLLDLTAVSLGLYRFAGVGALPLWTATLWLSFSVWWLALLKDWRPSPRLLAVIGAIAGPLAYWSACACAR